MLDALPEDLLDRVLSFAGARALASAACACRRMRASQQRLALLPSFAASLIPLKRRRPGGEILAQAIVRAQGAAEDATRDALERMPAAVDFAIVFCSEVRDFLLL